MQIRDPILYLLKFLKGKWLFENTDINILDYVSDLKYKITRACEITRGYLKQNQIKMKQWYDKDARIRLCKPGDRKFLYYSLFLLIQYKLNVLGHMYLNPD